MDFSELERIMFSRGNTSLADIARALDTTPQAVSNWKARNQIPFHVVNKIKIDSSNAPNKNLHQSSKQSIDYNEKDKISFSDVFLILAEQLKVIVFIGFISVFLTFTYVQFIKEPIFQSKALLLLPENSNRNVSGLAGLASQFGVNVPTTSEADLSSPILIPEILKSRTFAINILDKNFFTEKYGEERTLLSILSGDEKSTQVEKEILVTKAWSTLKKIIKFSKDPGGAFSVIKVNANEPIFAKKLADEVLNVLDDLNRSFKSQNVNEKISFIENRIIAVKRDLSSSEQGLKKFNEQNQQVSSPSLQLELDRLSREVEIQKGIFLTLKQQFELAKIEEIQQASIVQILDSPQIPISPSNIDLKSSVLLSSIIGIFFGMVIGFLRSHINNSDVYERRKIRRIKNYMNKKSKDILLDYKFTGLISLIMILGFPFYIGHKSQNPIFFDRFSTKLLIINILYTLVLVAGIVLTTHSFRKKMK